MYRCTVCHTASLVKLGKCPSCGSFGTIEKDITDSWSTSTADSTPSIDTIIRRHTDTPTETKIRPIRDRERQRVLTEWIRTGGIYLLSGEPGIGKSTFVAQLINHLTSTGPQILYVSGEEHPDMITQRYQRLHGTAGSHDVIFATTREDVISQLETESRDIVIIDSLQTMSTSKLTQTAWSVAQMKYLAEQAMHYGKSTDTTMILIGHVTKTGDIAGPKYVEHIVDVVMYIDGDNDGNYRSLKTTKNRFWPSHDTAFFEMTQRGLFPVHDYAERLLSSHHDHPGSVLTIGRDHGRCLLAYVEVLLVPKQGTYPQRHCVGIDSKRVDMICAILMKYLDVKLANYDMYLNIPGEGKFHDSGIDLAIAVSILSQYAQRSINPKKICVGEINLNGRIRKPKHLSSRYREIPDGYQCIDHNHIESVTDIKSVCFLS